MPETFTRSHDITSSDGGGLEQNVASGTDMTMPATGLHATRTQCHALSARMVHVSAWHEHCGPNACADGADRAASAVLFRLCNVCLYVVKIDAALALTAYAGASFLDPGAGLYCICCACAYMSVCSYSCTGGCTAVEHSAARGRGLQTTVHSTFYRQ